MAHLFKRGRKFYLKYYVAGKQKETSLRTDSLQIAKEKQRQFESALAQGGEISLPTRTPIADVLSAYVEHIRAVKTAKSAQTDVYYLREMFGPVCNALQVTSRRTSSKTKKKITKPDERGRQTIAPIEAACFEAISTNDIARFIDTKIRRQGIAPKTANHYRSILRRVFNWAMKQHGIRIPERRNPAAELEPYREKDRKIRYLTLTQIDEQLYGLRLNPQLQTMVATLIYAGLRRAELLWLTREDVCLRAGKHGVLRIQPKEYNREEWCPKTGRARAVPISSSLRVFLDRYTPRPSDGPHGGWFFPSPNGVRWEEDNFSADLRTANIDIGLPWTCLDYRHTFGSQLAQRGVSLYKTSTLMGNSPDICRRHYAALLPHQLNSEVEFTDLHPSYGEKAY